MGDFRYKKMRYKIGDKVKMKREGWLGPVATRNIDSLPNRVATIKEVLEDIDGYRMEEVEWVWGDDKIEYLVVDEVSKPIKSRWEILDIREV